MYVLAYSNHWVSLTGLRLLTQPGCGGPQAVGSAVSSARGR
jgi:hypothetical protein